MFDSKLCCRGRATRASARSPHGRVPLPLPAKDALSNAVCSPKSGLTIGLTIIPLVVMVVMVMARSSAIAGIIAGMLACVHAFTVGAINFSAVGFQRHFRNSVLKPHPDSRVGNPVGIRVDNQLGTHQKGREQTQERWSY
jgi:hypothetical protein